MSYWNFCKFSEITHRKAVLFINHHSGTHHSDGKSWSSRVHALHRWQTDDRQTDRQTDGFAMSRLAKNTKINVHASLAQMGHHVYRLCRLKNLCRKSQLLWFYLVADRGVIWGGWRGLWTPKNWDFFQHNTLYIIFALIPDANVLHWTNYFYVRQPCWST